MQIILNGQPEEVAENTTVLALLRTLELSPDVVTVDLNGEVISREDFSASALKEGDKVEVLLFMGGGM